MHAAVEPMSTLPAPARENVARSACTGRQHTTACDTCFPLLVRCDGGACDEQALGRVARSQRSAALLESAQPRFSGFVGFRGPLPVLPDFGVEEPGSPDDFRRVSVR